MKIKIRRKPNRHEANEYVHRLVAVAYYSLGIVYFLVAIFTYAVTKH